MQFSERIALLVWQMLEIIHLRGAAAVGTKHDLMRSFVSDSKTASSIVTGKKVFFQNDRILPDRNNFILTIAVEFDIYVRVGGQPKNAAVLRQPHVRNVQAQIFFCQQINICRHMIFLVTVFEAVKKDCVC